MADCDMNGHTQEGFGDEQMETTESTENTQVTVNDEEDDEDDRKLFVGGLHLDTKAEGLQSYCEKFGEVESCELKMNPSTGSSRCFAFVVFKDTASVTNFLKQEKHELDSKIIDPKIATKQEDATKIFVGGLSSDATDEEIRAHFEKFGKIEEITVPLGPDKKRKSFAFVIFKSRSSVAKATADRLHTIHGKECEVKKSVPRGGMRGGRGGPRGGGGGRGGYNQGSYNQYPSYGGGYHDQNYGGYNNYYGNDYYGYGGGWGWGGGYDQGYGGYSPYTGYDQSGFGKSRGRGGRGYRPY